MTWHPQLDNPTFLGWSVVAAYGIAALSCAWVGWQMGPAPGTGRKVWWLLAAGLLFLGVNKQLNLQTLMIVLGRQAADAGGWYARRRLAQGVFCVAFVLGGVIFLRLFAAQAGPFIRANRLAFVGINILLAFVVLRAVTINHGNALFGVDLYDQHWAWALELCGSFFIIASAVRAAKSIRGHLKESI